MKGGIKVKTLKKKSTSTLTPAEDKLSKARIHLVCTAPFFGSVALGVPCILDERAVTACTDGRQIRFAPSFLAKLDTRQVVGLIVHEVLHIILKHSLFREDRDPKLWNCACDYAINLIIKDGGYYLPPNGLVDEQYRGLSAFQIYEVLAQEAGNTVRPDEDEEQEEGEGDEESGDGAEDGDEEQDGDTAAGSNDPAKSPTGWGDVEDPTDEQGKALSESALQEVSDKIDGSVAVAESTARLAGNLPAELDRVLGEAKKPLVNWRDALRKHLSEISRDDWSWRRPSRRHRDFVLPSLHSEGLATILVTVDTSGSIDRDQFEQALGEVCEVAQSIKGKVFLGSCDTEHYGFEEYSYGDPLPELKGGGGTDFRDSDRAVEEIIATGEEVKVHLFITDGLTSSWGSEIVPTVWAIHSDPTQDIHPPFGERLDIPRGSP